MTSNTPTAVARASAPAIGPWVPAATLHVAFVAVAAGLCLLVFGSRLWLTIGLVLAVAAMVVPHLVSPWWLVFILGVDQVWRTPSATDGVFYALLAGVHLLHLLGGLTVLLPWDARIQVAALAGPLRRFVLVQAVAQPVAYGALVAFSTRGGTVPGLSILSAALLGVVAAVLAHRAHRARVRVA
jgi:hypothetical protein